MTNLPLPNGRRPKHIAQALEDWPDTPAFLFQCEKCGGWYDRLDPFVPYHFDMCRCKKCQAESL